MLQRLILPALAPVVLTAILLVNIAAANDAAPILEFAPPERLRIDYEYTLNFLHDRRDPGKMSEVTFHPTRAGVLSIRMYDEQQAIVLAEELPLSSGSTRTMNKAWFFEEGDLSAHLSNISLLMGHEQGELPPLFWGAACAVYGLSITKENDQWATTQLSCSLGPDAFAPVADRDNAFERRTHRSEQPQGVMETWQEIVLDPTHQWVAETAYRVHYEFPNGEKYAMPTRKIRATETVNGLPVAFEIIDYDLPNLSADFEISILDWLDRFESGDTSVVHRVTTLREISRQECTADDAPIGAFANDIKFVVPAEGEKPVPIVGVPLADPHEGPWATFDPATRTFVIQ